MIDALIPSDAAAASVLSAGFGWPHRQQDWTWFLGLGQGVAWREDGVLLGTAMFFPIDPRHGSIGLVQVAPALQGRGIGRRLMHATIALADDRSLLLHATPEGAGLYASLGFVAGYTVRQWQGVTQAGNGPHRPASDWTDAAKLDKAATGLSRDSLLQHVSSQSEIAISGPFTAPTGYAMRRKFGRGALIGPIIAGNEAEAIQLVQTLRAPGFTRLDLVGHAPLLEQALSQSGLSCVDEVRSMVRGSWPEAGTTPRLFGLATQATG